MTYHPRHSIIGVEIDGCEFTTDTEFLPWVHKQTDEGTERYQPCVVHGVKINGAWFDACAMGDDFIEEMEYEIQRMPLNAAGDIDEAAIRMGKAVTAERAAEAAQPAMHVEIQADPELLRRAVAAETEVSLLRASSTQPEPAAVPADPEAGTALWARDGIANFIADNWPDRKHTLAEIEAGIRAIEITPARPSPSVAQPAPAGVVEALRALLDMDVAYKRGPAVEQAVEVARAALAAADAAQAAPVQAVPLTLARRLATELRDRMCSDCKPSYSGVPCCMQCARSALEEFHCAHGITGDKHG